MSIDKENDSPLSIIQKILGIDYFLTEDLESSDKVYESIKKRHLLAQILGM